MKKIKSLQILGLLLLVVAVVTGCGGGSNDDPPATNVIHFSMPSIYFSPSNSSVHGEIPSGKTIKFYTLTAANYDELSNDSSGTATVKADHTFTATTGASDLQFALPVALLEQERYIFAVVIINGSFNLNGKTKADLQSAVAAGNIIYGKTVDASGNNQSVTLTKNGTVANFEFVGTVDTQSSFINITMPTIYYDYSSSDYSSATRSSIPTGKTVKFYTLTSTTVSMISADQTFTVTTGAATLQLILPDTLIDESRYIWAVVILKGDFDLQGKSKEDLVTALQNGSILYGKATDSAISTESSLVTLTNGSTVSHFVFIGKI
jgi:hypothetical protein